MSHALLYVTLAIHNANILSWQKTKIHVLKIENAQMCRVDPHLCTDFDQICLIQYDGSTDYDQICPHPIWRTH